MKSKYKLRNTKKSLSKKINGKSYKKMLDGLKTSLEVMKVAQVTRESAGIVFDTGDDYIFNTGDKVLFKYNTVDEHDVIEGFNETSTLRIDDDTGTYSKATSEDGFNIIVTFGEDTLH